MVLRTPKAISATTSHCGVVIAPSQASVLLARESQVALYGREELVWDQLADAGTGFLIDRARLGRLTSYSELNAVLTQRTQLPGFDFSRADERLAMGHLLNLIVELNRPASNLMISALVCYLDANHPGSGFYALAQDLGLLSRNASAQQKLDFWVGQVKALHEYYAQDTNAAS